MENKIKYGIIGLISLLVGFGGYMTMTQGELDNSYYCPSSGEFGVFYGGISSTGLTAYPYAENKTDYERCTGSKWVLLKEYADEMNVTIGQVIEMQPENNTGQISNSWGKQYKCNQINCVEIIK